MKLHQPSFGHLNAITAYGDGFIEVNKQRHEGAIMVLPEGPVVSWVPQQFDGTRLERIKALTEHAPQLILLGTGRHYHRVPGELLAWAHQAGIGLECQTTPAACRTFNILVSEGRRVCAVLFVEP